MSRGASLYDFRDMDLLFGISREGDNDGWSQVETLAHAMGFRNGDGNRAMAIRLSWMQRYGMVEYSGERRMWRLSPGGVRVTEAHLKAAQQRTIEAVPDEALVDVMSHITGRYMHGDPLIANLLRREFQFGTHPR